MPSADRPLIIDVEASDRRDRLKWPIGATIS